MAFSVKATLVAFIGDPERYPCHADYEIGDTIYYDGKHITGEFCTDLMPQLINAIVNVHKMGPRYVMPDYYNLFWHSVNSSIDRDRAKYDGNGYKPINMEYDEPAHHLRDALPKGGFVWPPTEERVACKDVMVLCPDVRTGAAFKVEAYDLAMAGFMLPYTRRQITIMDKIAKNGGSCKDTDVIGLYTDFEINEIYPTLVPAMVREMAEELALLDFVTYEDGIITVTEKGKERVKKYAQEIPEEHAKAMGLI